jgi:hypothetical protein
MGAALAIPNVVCADPNSIGFNPIMVQLSQGPAMACGLMLNVSGGTFAPDECRFEVISGGPECKSPAGCPSDYALLLRSTKPGPDEINSITLFNFREFKTGTYSNAPERGLLEFKGQLLDGRAIARRLLYGTVKLDIRSSERLHVSGDVHFENGITAQWSGEMDVKRVFAP